VRIIDRINMSLEGVTIALDAMRANKVRAGLTILGVAVGVFVVVVISAAVHGINASVARPDDVLRSALAHHVRSM
jgi:putative ABC transport system permease protein